MAGADLSRANLVGVDLSDTNLIGATLVGARASSAMSDAFTNLSAVDIRGIDFGPVTENEKPVYESMIAAIPSPVRRQEAINSLAAALRASSPNLRTTFYANKRQPLLANDGFLDKADQSSTIVITEPREPYLSALTELLVDVVAAQGRESAHTVVKRTRFYLQSDSAPDRAIGRAIGCSLLAAADRPDGTVYLSKADHDQLRAILSVAQTQCPEAIQ